MSADGVTFSDNRAGAYGGAMYNNLKTSTSTGNASFNNVTFSGNYARFDSGAIYNDVATGGANNSILKNVILWDNGTSPIANKHAATAELQDSVLQDSCPAGSTCSGNMVYSDPLLSTLQDNGGLTHTMLPDVDSPAIDAGSNATCEATDQCGVMRPQGDYCDIGAVAFLADSIFADGYEAEPI